MEKHGWFESHRQFWVMSPISQDPKKPLKNPGMGCCCRASECRWWVIVGQKNGWKERSRRLISDDDDDDDDDDGGGGGGDDDDILFCSVLFCLDLLPDFLFAPLREWFWECYII